MSTNPGGAEHPLIGADLGNYTVKRILGQGGMGAVFAGAHKFLGTAVAIKVLHGSYAHDPGITQRFFQEAKSSIDIGHPGIIKILDFGQTPDGALYLVMELLDGLSLGDAIAAANGFAEPELVRLGSQMCDALEAAHALGIVHRDLKPDNIFILRNGDVKILDFGIAKVASSGNSTKTGSLMGTPSYMAPEQCRDSKLVGPQTDVYAMGVILFEMATAQRPFQGELAEVLAKHLFEPPPLPSSVRADISPELERLILQCMEKQPADRPAGMGTLRDRLRGLSTQQMDPSRAQHTLSAVQAMRSQLSSPSLSSPSLVAPTRGRGALLGVITLVVLIAGGLGAWRILSKKTPAPTVEASLPVDKAPVAPEPKVAEAPPKAEVAPTPVAAAVTPPTEVAPKKLVIRTEPPGAKVTVAGRDRGTTPLVIDDPLPVEVTLSLSGYKPSQEVVTTTGESIFHLVADRHHGPVAHGKAVSAPLAAKPPAAREGLE